MVRLGRRSLRRECVDVRLLRRNNDEPSRAFFPKPRSSCIRCLVLSCRKRIRNGHAGAQGQGERRSREHGNPRSRMR